MKKLALVFVIVVLGGLLLIIFRQREAQRLMLTKIEVLRLEALGSAIDWYARDSSNKRLPTNLKILLTDDGGFQAIRSELLSNPWGCAVNYEPNDTNRSYILRSLGADCKTGGKVENFDIEMRRTAK